MNHKRIKARYYRNLVAGDLRRLSPELRNWNKMFQQISNREWTDWIRIASECANIAMSLRDKPKTLDYASAGIRLVNTIVQDPHNKEDSLLMLFENNSWEFFFMRGMQFAIFDMLRNHSAVKTIKSKDNTLAKSLQFDGIEFGWIEYRISRDSFDGPWFRGSLDRINQALYSMFWQQIGGKNAQMAQVGSLLSGTSMLFIPDPFDLVGCLISQETNRQIKRVRKFSQAARPWSILFKGPPGTGKSTMIKQIAYALDKRTVRIPVYDVGFTDPNKIVSFVEIFKPEVLILDDLDRISNPINLLDGLEKYRAKTGIVLASMNSTKACTPALLRPGRFDDIVTIDCCDPQIVQQLVSINDKNYETIKNWPIAYIRSYCDQRDILGQEEATAAVIELDKRHSQIQIKNEQSKIKLEEFEERNLENENTKLCNAGSVMKG